MKLIEDLDVRGKTVFVRVDFNVPLSESGEIRNDTRIRASLPTIRFLSEHGAKLILASHLGRPKKFDPAASLRPAAVRLAELLDRKVEMAPDVIGPDVDRLKAGLRDGGVLLLENVRFQPGETKNDPELAREFARGVDVFVNDAFGSSHRAHASVVGVAGLVPVKAAGYLLKKEVEFLGKVLHPVKPFTAVLGGAKTEDKIPVIESLLDKADDVLIGGAMAYTFLAAQGKGVGKSLVEPDKFDLALGIMKKAADRGVRLRLPSDHALAPSIDSGVIDRMTGEYPFPDVLLGVDIGPKTIATYSAIIGRAKTVFWNGPLGVFENPAFAEGTMQIAQAVAASPAVSIIGGGDSIAAVAKAGVGDRIGHISTGGGASLEFIAKGTLPGLDALEG